MEKPLAVIVLAAGKGKRLGGKSQKVVRKIHGKPILLYLYNTIKNISPERVVVIVGYKKEEVFRQLEDKNVEYAEQKMRMGTGDAVLQAKEALKTHSGDVLVLCGDIPFIKAETLRMLVSAHNKGGNCCTILTAVLNNPFGYGRIKRDTKGNVLAIVEELNATEEERKIREVNSGIYVFEKQSLFAALSKVVPDKVKKEYYLTDVLSILVSEGSKIGTCTTETPEECMGINSEEDIKKAEQFVLLSGKVR